MNKEDKYFSDDLFKGIIMEEIDGILVWITLMLVPGGLIDKKITTVSGNDLALNTTLANTWTNDHPVHWTHIRLNDVTTVKSLI